MLRKEIAMKTVLLQAGDVMLLYFILSFFVLIVVLMLARWIFDISAIIKNQKEQIALLKKIADK